MTADTRSPATIQGDAVYQYLERRTESWRRELYLKGRNMTVGQLVYDMRANQITPAEAVENYGLPLEQIQEALLYYERHKDLIEADVDEEQRRLEARGIPVDPPALPR